MFYEIFLSPQVKRWAIVIYKHSISSRFDHPSPAQPPRQNERPAIRATRRQKAPTTRPTRQPPPEPPPEQKQTDPISISQPSQPRHARNPKIQPKLGKQARQQASQISQPSHTTPQQSISHQLQKFLKPTEITRGWYLYFHFFFFFCFDTNLFYLSALIPERAMRAENQPALLYHWFALAAHCNFGIPANSLYTKGNLS